eukprot:TRINITY_DN31305_c0_g1_i1.p1 TRINITY_DN31305_c0_g1~~TRINITY_DN31305_c0_g1_i1.p1  ORF type:complete len:117 (-),score=14.83 TRINITY_DN31305_c0_g1_i1:101-451(-)
MPDTSHYAENWEKLNPMGVLAAVSMMVVALSLCVIGWQLRNYILTQNFFITVAAASFMALPFGLHIMKEARMSFVLVPVGLAFIARGVIGPGIHFMVQQFCQKASARAGLRDDEPI